jgi:hypothetical protein
MLTQAASNDKVTVDSWRKVWVDNMRANREKFGSFNAMSIAQLNDCNLLKPAIVIGSGPSLAYNVDTLKTIPEPGVMTLSCLHNFHYLADRGIKVDYYVSLDAGEVTIEEISEGGEHPHDYYIEQTKDKTLLAYAGSSPKLLESWRGKILFFTASLPDEELMKEVKSIEDMADACVSNGGNVLGACTYIARTFFGSSEIVFMGADFAFSYMRGFHPWKSKYDAQLGNAVRTTDVWGNSVLTWPSYHNFKLWFEYVACQCSGYWTNCTEGGTLGAYPQGNIEQIKQMTLKQWIDQKYIHQDVIYNPIDIPSGKTRLLF